MLSRLLKPIIDEAYQKGYDTGVLAEKLLKDEERIRHEHETLSYGMALGRKQAYDEMACEEATEEISEEEFNTIVAESEPKEPFGFVGTIDDIALILED